MPLIAIIVLNWKQPKLTTDTIDSLLKINHPNFDYQIYLVDNKSPDNSFETFHQKYGKNKTIKLLQTDSNLGFVGGNNFGLKAALDDQVDYFLVINNDVAVHPDFLHHLLLAQQTSSYNLGIVGPKIYFAPHHEYHYSRYSDADRGKVIWSLGGQMDWNNILGSNLHVDEIDKGQFTQTLINPDFISGCCQLISRQVIEKVGFYDPAYFMYLEDTDFCRRAQKAGFDLAIIPDSIIWHINAGSSQTGGSLHDYFITRNRLIFAFRYAKLRTRLALIKESLRFLLSSNRWKKQGVIDFYLHRWNRGSWQ